MSETLVPASFTLGGGPYPGGGYDTKEDAHRLDCHTHHAYQYDRAAQRVKLGTFDNGAFVPLEHGTHVDEFRVTRWRRQ